MISPDCVEDVSLYQIHERQRAELGLWQINQSFKVFFAGGDGVGTAMDPRAESRERDVEIMGSLADAIGRQLASIRLSVD